MLKYNLIFTMMWTSRVVVHEIIRQMLTMQSERWNAITNCAATFNVEEKHLKKVSFMHTP